MTTPDPTTAAIVRQLEGLTLYEWRTDGGVALYDYGIVQAHSMEEAVQCIERHLRDDMHLDVATYFYVSAVEPSTEVGVLRTTEEFFDVAYVP